MPTDARLGVDAGAADEVRRVQLVMQAAAGQRLTLGEVLRRLVRLYQAWGNDPGMTEEGTSKDA